MVLSVMNLNYKLVGSYSVITRAYLQRQDMPYNGLSGGFIRAISRYQYTTRQQVC